MNLEEKLRRIKQAASRSTPAQELERQLEHLRRAERISKKLPAKRVPKGIEEYVEGRAARNAWGEFFLARQTLPFGRPYGRLRIGEVATADLSPLGLLLENADLPHPSQLVYLDTETTGLVGGTGTCAFLIGIGAAVSSQFVVRQFFLRDHPEEKAMLAALTEALDPYQGLVTFNGKTFDIPLLETRYALARMKSPFTRLLHLDVLHPARRLWKLRLETCELTHLESELLGISREGDVPGSEIPGIYFDYLRTGDARGLQPIFYHNALDIITLAAVTTELARVLGDAGADGGVPSLDLFSLSRIFDRAGVGEKSVKTCQKALAAGLPQSVESRAMWHLASQYKRQGKHALAIEIWLELTRRELPLAIEAFQELAIYYEHHRRDFTTAAAFTEAAIQRLQENPGAGFKPAPATPRSHQKAQAGLKPAPTIARFEHRLQRLRRKSACAGRAASLPLVIREAIG